jgi:hypothetical protein
MRGSNAGIAQVEKGEFKTQVDLRQDPAQAYKEKWREVYHAPEPVKNIPGISFIAESAEKLGTATSSFIEMFFDSNYVKTKNGKIIFVKKPELMDYAALGAEGAAEFGSIYVGSTGAGKIAESGFFAAKTIFSGAVKEGATSFGLAALETAKTGVSYSAFESATGELFNFFFNPPSQRRKPGEITAEAFNPENIAKNAVMGTGFKAIFPTPPPTNLKDRLIHNAIIGGTVSTTLAEDKSNTLENFLIGGALGAAIGEAGIAAEKSGIKLRVLMLKQK